MTSGQLIAVALAVVFLLTVIGLDLWCMPKRDDDSES